MARILILCHSFNCLAQRCLIALEADGHQVSVELDINDAVTRSAIAEWRPDIVVAPYLKRRIPADICQQVPCLVVHPGPPGDGGPGSVDHIAGQGGGAWGVTILQAVEDLDRGPIWASGRCTLPALSKGALYRSYLAPLAVACLRQAIDRLLAGGHPELPPDPVWRPLPGRRGRQVDWQQMTSATILGIMHGAEGRPGIPDQLAGRACRWFDPWPEYRLRGRPGSFLATAHGALCRATVDGALWIGHGAWDANRIKLPAAAMVPQVTLDLPFVRPPARATGGCWRGAKVTRHGAVAVVHFDPLNGSMSASWSRRVLLSLRRAQRQGAKVIILWSEADQFCTGIDLNAIEQTNDPGQASLASIEALNDLVAAIITATDQLVIAALAADAAAGGVFLAAAADQVVAHESVILNPHYQSMGGLHGSEYWTYLVPRRCGDNSAAVADIRTPIGPQQARDLGLIDVIDDGSAEGFLARVIARAQELAADQTWCQQIAGKRQRRQLEEQQRPLADYRAQELIAVRRNFFGPDPSYHLARYNFVHRVPETHTPLYLARHRHRQVQHA